MVPYANVIVSTCLLLALPGAGSAFGVDFWRDADGLTQSRIRDIAQTRDGFLWLATDGGLIRFNGNSFRAFTTESGDLKDNEVWALQEDN
jgi:ligand-binding sensor domain-containing protein